MLAMTMAVPPDLPQLPPGAPPDFRERLAIALKTTNPDVLAAAEDAFRGVFVSSDEYIRETIGSQIGPHLQWVLSCSDPRALREGYENKVIAVWEIRLDDQRVMTFESLRSGKEAYQVPLGNQRITVYARRG